MVLQFTSNNEVFAPLLNNAAANNIIVTSNCQVIPRSPTIMGVRVSAGTIAWNGSTASVSQTDLAVGANATAFIRYDLILVNSAGTASISAGTAAATPLTPSYDNSTYYVLAVIKVRAGTSTIESADIFDGRIVGTISSGTVTSVASGTGLTGGPITTTGTLAVDVGTTANKIVQLDSSARIPAVNASLVTNINASNIASGTIADARLPTSMGAKTFTDDVTVNTKVIPDTDGGADLGTAALKFGTIYANNIVSSATTAAAKTIISGLTLSATGAQTIGVAAGSFYNSTGSIVASAGDAALALSAASGANPRFDLITIDDSATLTVTDGTAAATPDLPATPANHTVIGYIYRPTSNNTSTDNQISELRTIYGTNVDKVYKYTFASSATWIENACKCFVKSLVNKSSYKFYKVAIRFKPVSNVLPRALAVTYNAVTSGYLGLRSETDGSENDIIHSVSTANINYLAIGGSVTTPFEYTMDIMANDGFAFRVAPHVCGMYNGTSNAYTVSASGITSAAVTTFESLNFFGDLNYTDLTLEIWGFK